MENKQNHHGGGGNGFILGVIVGVVITLLFTTKRGRQILRVLTEKGFEKFSDFEEVFDEEEDMEGEDYVEHPATNGVAHPQPTETPRQIPASSNPPSSLGKRFFKKKN